VLLYLLVSGRLPFEAATDSELLMLIIDCKYKMPRQGVSADCTKYNYIIVKVDIYINIYLILSSVVCIDVFASVFQL